MRNASHFTVCTAGWLNEFKAHDRKIVRSLLVSNKGSTKQGVVQLCLWTNSWGLCSCIERDHTCCAGFHLFCRISPALLVPGPFMGHLLHWVSMYSWSSVCRPFNIKWCTNLFLAGLTDLVHVVTMHSPRILMFALGS